jgi:hypothetical protein
MSHAPAAERVDGRTSPEAPPGTHRRRNGVLPWILGVLGLGVLALVLFMGARLFDGSGEMAGASHAPSVVVGTPGGFVLSPPTATPAPEPTPSPTPRETPAPSPTVPPSPLPTAAPTAVATEAPTPEPEPTAVAVAVADPVEAVAAFYANVANGDFDSAYTLWSDRMKERYPREGNLDQRFAETSEITFHDLRLADLSGGSATVQANFTETYESGTSRTFIGYWRLVEVGGRWVLDEPHY